MPFLRLTLWGRFASLRGECAGSGCPERGAARGRSVAPPLRWLAWATLGLAATLAGCASLSVDSTAAQKQELVAQRAQARWDLLMKGDVEGAYQFLSAEIGRASCRERV